MNGGDDMAEPITIKDIANLCGVSIATVSRVVNNSPKGVGEKTVERIRKVIEEVGYRPNRLAQSMITKVTHTIGLVIPDVRNPFFSELVRGVEDVCNENGYSCFLCNTDGKLDKENEYIDILRDRVVDGLLFTTQNDKEFNPAFLDFHKNKTPLCFIERYVDELPETPGVFFDNEGGAALLTQFVLDKGHRHIAFISGPLSTMNARMRKSGFMSTMEKNGIEVDTSLVVEGNYRLDSGYAAVDQLLAPGKPKFTALIAGNDLMALGAYQALVERGYEVPKDISIAGFDNITYPAVFRPLITTIEIPGYKLGSCGTQMLIAQMKGQPLAVTRQVFAAALRDKGSIIQI
jgi:LacI family transcriptional regulator